MKAVIFDLYGTLVFARERLVHKDVPRALGVPGRRWVELIRNELLVRSFPDTESFARFVCERLAPVSGLEAEARVRELVEREIASVELGPGVRSLLAFLERRGFVLGLLSNLASPHKAPLERLGLGERFAAAGFSCDAGMAKPAPAFYLGLLGRLGASPAEALMVGDSQANDVDAPRQLGLHALLVDPSGAEASLRRVADLGWRALTGAAPLDALLRDGDRVELGGRTGVLRGLTMLPDDQQGRYNLVASARVESDGGSRDVFCKRFLFPEAAHVEEFAHRIHAALGQPSCEVFVSAGVEPCLVVTKAAGVKMEQGPVTPALAREIGRQCALAYLFANADLRPRNAFVTWENGEPRITMVDLEHCFFNMALDVAGLDDPLRPETFDRLSDEELQRRVLKRVLTERATRRARRTFFETESLDSELASTFREGWIEVYRRAHREADRLCALLDERVARPPYLIIGTHSYRRAMARADVRDIRRRIEQDPEKVFAACF